MIFIKHVSSVFGLYHTWMKLTWADADDKTPQELRHAAETSHRSSSAEHSRFIKSSLWWSVCLRAVASVSVCVFERGSGVSQIKESERSMKAHNSECLQETPWEEEPLTLNTLLPWCALLMHRSRVYLIKILCAGNARKPLYVLLL